MGEGEEGVTQKEAIELWNALKIPDEYQRKYRIVSLIIGDGFGDSPLKIIEIAEFLRSWADALEDK